MSQQQRVEQDVAIGEQLLLLLRPESAAALSHLSSAARRAAALNLCNAASHFAFDAVTNLCFTPEAELAATLSLVGPVAASPAVTALANIFARMLLNNVVSDVHATFLAMQYLPTLAQYGSQRTDDYATQRDTEGVLAMQRQTETGWGKKTVIDFKPRRPPHADDYLVARHVCRPMPPSNLQWFSWHVGHVVEGTLTSFHITMSGNTMFMCRSVDNTRFEVFVSATVPPIEERFLVGARLRVHDPYLRVDRSMMSSIRVDCVADMIIVPDPPLAPLSLQAAKALGDERLRANEPLAALDEYWSAIHQRTTFGLHREVQGISAVVALLSNSALCYLKLDQPVYALTAAAWARALAPDHPKALHHYNKALALVNSGGESALRCLLGTQVDQRVGLPTLSGDAVVQAQLHKEHARHSADALHWKESGNTLFNEGKFACALEAYLLGLQDPGVSADLGAMLSNIANALSRERLWVPTLAVCPMAAFFSPVLYAKNLHRYTIALLQLGLREQVEALTAVISDDGIKRQLQTIADERFEGRFDFAAFCRGTAQPQAPFVGPLVMKRAPGKGRGLFATRDIRRGDLVMASKALAGVAKSDLQETVPRRRNGVTIVSYGKVQLTESDSVISQHMQRKAALPVANTWLRDVYVLCDYSTATANAVCDPIAIPSGHEAAWLARPFDVTPFPSVCYDLGRVFECCSMNSFGSGGHSALHLWPSLLNHDQNANLLRETFGDWMFLFAARDVATGDELTVTYFGQEVELTEPSHLEKWSVPVTSFPSPRYKQRATELLVALTSESTVDVLRCFEEALGLPDEFPKGIQGQILGLGVVRIASDPAIPSKQSHDAALCYTGFLSKHGVVPYCFATDMILRAPRDVRRAAMAQIPFAALNCDPCDDAVVRHLTRNHAAELAVAGAV